MREMRLIMRSLGPVCPVTQLRVAQSLEVIEVLPSCTYFFWLSSSLNLISASDRIDDQAESSVPWSEKESKPVPRALKRNFFPGKAEPKSEQETSPTTNAKKRGRFEKNDFVKKIFIDYPCSRSDCRPERFDGKNVYFDDDDSSNDGGDYKRQAKERFRVFAFCKAL